MIADLLTEAGARAAVAAAMDAAAADDVRVVLSSSRAGHTRYAANLITTAADVEDQAASVTCAFGPRHATVTTHDLSPDGLQRAMARAEAMAKVASPDPEFVPDAGPAAVTPVPAAWDEPSSHQRPDLRADVAAGAIAEARRRNLQAAGFLEERARATCVGTRRGFFGYHRETAFSFSTTARTADGTGSGWAGLRGVRRGDVDAAALSQRAAALAETSQHPAPLDPGTYPAVLSAQVLADLLPYLVEAMDQRAADEGRSFFSRLRGPRPLGGVTLRSDPADPLVAGAPFDTAGVLRPAAAWIDKGVVKQLHTSRYWAKKTGRKPTAQPDSLILSASGAPAGTADELLTGLKRGLLLTRIWYVRMLEPQTLTVTGLTRDGTFLVEGGKIIRPVNNFRFNQSIPELLAAIELATAPLRTAGPALACPAVRVRALHCSSVSEAV